MEGVEVQVEDFKEEVVNREEEEIRVDGRERKG